MISGKGFFSKIEKSLFFTKFSKIEEIIEEDFGVTVRLVREKQYRSRNIKSI